jgi:hypothetical protein
LSACGSVRLDELKVSDQGLCDGLSAPIDELNDALLVDGGPATIVAGEKVISGYDGGCPKDAG